MKDYRSTKHQIWFKKQKKLYHVQKHLQPKSVRADKAFWGLKSIAGMHEQLWSVMIQFKPRCNKVWKPTLAHTSVAVWHIREIFIKIWLNTPFDRFFISWIICCYTFFGGSFDHFELKNYFRFGSVTRYLTFDVYFVQLPW